MYISLVNHIFRVLHVVLIQNLPPSPTYARKSKKNHPTNIQRRRSVPCSSNSFPGQIARSIETPVYSTLGELIAPKLIHRLDSIFVQSSPALGAFCCIFGSVLGAQGFCVQKGRSSLPMRHVPSDSIMYGIETTHLQTG